MPEDEATRRLQTIRRVYDSGEGRSVEMLTTIMRRKRWLQGSTQPIKDEAGAVVGVLSLSIDVTDRKLVEAEQQKLAQIVETATDFIGIADLEGNVEYVNPAGLELVGLDSIAATERHITEFLIPSDVETLNQDVMPAIMNQGKWIGDFQLKQFVTGESVPVEMNAFLIRDDETGEPIAIANVSRNLQERKRAEDALRESESQVPGTPQRRAGRHVWSVTRTAGFSNTSRPTISS